VGFVGLRFRAAAAPLQWELIARHKTVVALPSKHPLAQKRRVALTELKTMFFVGMSEKTHPGFREWLAETCETAGFIPRILQDADLEPGLMRFVAEGLGVTLVREQIKNIPHPGVTFRPLAAPVKAEYWIAWSRDNNSSALRDYVEIVKTLARAPS
jgi:DNA-binding transcriptional LysR family regulator